MTKELMPCPFCGGEVSVVVLDEEGNIRDEEYERDPYSGLSYAVAHDDPNGACPIATYDEPLPWLYDSRDGVAHVWNRRAERTCGLPVVRDEEECERHAGVGVFVAQEIPLCRKCTSCGRQYSPVARLPEWLRYCPYCGAKVVDE